MRIIRAYNSGVLLNIRTSGNVAVCKGDRTIRRWTIRRGRFVADYSLHGQFVTRHFVARQFVVYIIRRKTIRCDDVN